MHTDRTGMFGGKASKEDDDLTSGYNMSFADNTAPLAVLAQ